MGKKPLAGIAAAVLAVTVFAGCGDDDDDDTPTDSVVPEVTTGATQPVTTTS